MSHSTATKDFAALASAIRRIRQVRDQVFEADYFSDPAWDMVLALRAKGPMSLSALVPVCRVPVSLLQRYCRILIEQGMIRMTAKDGPDYYELTDEAVTKLDRVFENVTIEISRSGTA
jgi:predicted transcriptional regulator